ncbi:hypothetical protein [Streptomyces lomondensis]|uniref:hypothetical protein n=1 Tax=Streptomyces lomondensis TaxID=68229 RepID=UPI001672C147|nr:hypothetical protein [Streptomyces lomondensis]MCF0078170.1 hypothetical protein [Streptomyces lomondensis]
MSALLATVAVASPVRADSAHGCPYPYACVYDEPDLRGSIVAKFRVVTSSTQSLVPPITGFSVFNTRNGDTVHIYYSLPSEPHGHWWGSACIGPNGWAGDHVQTLREIRIDSSPSC